MLAVWHVIVRLALAGCHNFSTKDVTRCVDSLSVCSVLQSVIVERNLSQLFPFSPLLHMVNTRISSSFQRQFVTYCRGHYILCGCILSCGLFVRVAPPTSETDRHIILE